MRKLLFLLPVLGFLALATWFALALRKDPANQAVQGDLQKLWGEMTQPERQLAIRLTQ